MMSLQYHCHVYATIWHCKVTSQQGPHLLVSSFMPSRPPRKCTGTILFQWGAPLKTGQVSILAPLLSMFAGSFMSCDGLMVTLLKSSTSSTYHLQTGDNLMADHADGAEGYSDTLLRLWKLKEQGGSIPSWNEIQQWSTVLNRTTVNFYFYLF